MKSYEVYIAPSAGSVLTRVVTIAARGYRAAFFAGQQECRDGEFVRGVVAV